MRSLFSHLLVFLLGLILGIGGIFLYLKNTPQVVVSMANEIAAREQAMIAKPPITIPSVLQAVKTREIAGKIISLDGNSMKIDTDYMNTSADKHSLAVFLDERTKFVFTIPKSREMIEKDRQALQAEASGNQLNFFVERETDRTSIAPGDMVLVTATTDLTTSSSSITAEKIGTPEKDITVARE